MSLAIKDILLELPEIDEKSVTDLCKILETPDYAFDQIYPEFKKNVQETFNSPSYRAATLNTLKTISINEETIDVEKENIESLIEKVNNDKQLSDNKKDILVGLLRGAFESTVEIFETMREIVNVEVVKIHPNAILPKYAHNTDAGADIYAIEDTVVQPNQTIIVPTGLKVAIPRGYMINIYPRSGMSAKTKIRIANAPGTIDTSYRNEVGIIVENIGSEPYEIKSGDRIAQMVIMPVPMIKWIEVEKLDDTERKGGFGSTGR